MGQNQKPSLQARVLGLTAELEGAAETVGAFVGGSVGIFVGAGVGGAVGVALGDAEGLEVGLAEGDADGDLVGTSL